MDYTCTRGIRRPGRPRYRWCVRAAIVCGSLSIVTVSTVGLITYIDHGVAFNHRSWSGGTGSAKEVPAPGYPGAADPDDQFAMTGENVDEDLVVPEGQLYARSDMFSRRYAKRDEGEVEAEKAAPGGDALPTPPFRLPVRPPPIKLPPLPLPTEIIDLPTAIPTHPPDLISDLPALPIPTNIGDIVDDLPTDPGKLLPTGPGDIIDDLPIPTPPEISIPPLPTITIPPLPTLPGPPPLPTLTIPTLTIPTLTISTFTTTTLTITITIPIPTGTDAPKAPKLPGGGLTLPDLTQVPKKIAGLLHNVLNKLGANPDTPSYFRHLIELIKELIDRLHGIGGGRDGKDLWPTSLPTSLPTTLPTIITIPTITWVPAQSQPTLPPKEGFVRMAKKDAAEGGEPVGRIAVERSDPVRASGDTKPLSDRRRRELMAMVRKEVLAEIEWAEDPLGSLVTVPLAMAAFDALYRVAEAWEGTDDEAQRKSLLSLLVVVDDDEEHVE
ncbi:hypothetical protein diail_4261 [Diaporthe ilicicola]|nr:hypothetical protein diail_4261 [Diaporthe ilicicola]